MEPIAIRRFQRHRCRHPANRPAPRPRVPV